MPANIVKNNLCRLPRDVLSSKNGLSCYEQVLKRASSRGTYLEASERARISFLLHCCTVPFCFFESGNFEEQGEIKNKLNYLRTKNIHRPRPRPWSTNPEESELALLPHRLQTSPRWSNFRRLFYPFTVLSRVCLRIKIDTSVATPEFGPKN